jgi:hypothetical protein
MVNDLLLVTVLLFQTQINTSYVRFEEKYVNFSDNMTFSVSMKDSQNHVILDDSDDILVGNMEVNNGTRDAELYSTSWVPENEMWDNGYNSDVLYFAIWRTHDYE